MEEKRLAIVYSLSGMPKSNDYTLTIKNLNRSEISNFKELISKLNKQIKKQMKEEKSEGIPLRLGDPTEVVEILPSIAFDSKNFKIDKIGFEQTYPDYKIVQKALKKRDIERLEKIAKGIDKTLDITDLYLSSNDFLELNKIIIKLREGM